MTTALLIIDVQNAIVEGTGTPERQPVIEAALELLRQSLEANPDSRHLQEVDERISP